MRHPDCAAVGPMVAALKALDDPRLGEIVPSYGSIMVMAGKGTGIQALGEALQKVLESNLLPIETCGKTVRIPCCYEMGPDLEDSAKVLGLSPDRLVTLHSESVYTVFAIGFQPGFPYCGWLPQEISGMPRRNTPRLRVEPGSVGITERQTGIYPVASPGGWNLIGVTPCQLVDLEKEWFALKAGDRVQFVPIYEKEFQRLLKSPPESNPGR